MYYSFKKNAPNTLTLWSPALFNPLLATLDQRILHFFCVRPSDNWEVEIENKKPLVVQGSHTDWINGEVEKFY